MFSMVPGLGVDLAFLLFFLFLALLGWFEFRLLVCVSTFERRLNHEVVGRWAASMDR